MEPFIAFKYLHVVAMFFAIALAVSGELVLRRVATSAHPASIRTTIERIEPLSRASDMLFLAGIVFGIVATLTGQMNLLAPWLVLAYVAVAAAFGIGGLILAPWQRRLHAAAEASPEAGGSVDLQTVVDDPAARVGTWALMALIATLVFLMVVKPFA